MFKRFLISLALLSLPFTAFADEIPDKTRDYVEEVSYLVETEGALGSCTLFAKGDRTFAWTAAHVVHNILYFEKVYKDEEVKEVPRFKPLYVVRAVHKDGKIVGQEKYEARVVVADFARDIALLRVLKPLTDKPVNMADHEVEVGRWLVHGGSRYGYYGIQSVSSGHLSQIGTFLEDFPELPYDLVTSPASPGSSGGGVFDAETGEYVGMVVRGAESTFILVVPSREIVRWAVKHGFSWAVVASAEAPSDEDLEKVFPVVGLVPKPDMYRSSTRDVNGIEWKTLIIEKNLDSGENFTYLTADNKPVVTVDADEKESDDAAVVYMFGVLACALGVAIVSSAIAGLFRSVP